MENLILGGNFNQKLENLPVSLQNLILRYIKTQINITLMNGKMFFIKKYQYQII